MISTFMYYLDTMHIFVGSGRGCTADNFFTSYDLAKSLLNRQLTFCGTVKKNRRFLPAAVLDARSRPVLSSKFAFHDDMTLVSYVPKKNKNVILLSTQHHNAVVHEDRQDKKPEMILHYNRTKGAVDTLDKLLRTYSCQRKSRRWPQVFFGHLVDTAAYNSFVIFLFCFPDFMKRKSHRRRLYLEKLALELMAGQTRRRRVVEPDAMNVPPPPAAGHPQRPRKRVRCDSCPREQDRKTMERCSACGKAVCKEHFRVVCSPRC